MRKQHRKKQPANTPRLERVDVRDLLSREQFSYDDAKAIVRQRMLWNLAYTGHPLHHRTQDGTIVEPDPAVEELLEKLSPDEQPPIPAALPGALPTVPVIRDWYEREPGRTWLAYYIERTSLRMGSDDGASDAPDAPGGAS